MLSPEAHLAASRAWRESLWVDLGIGFCGLSAFLPCENRLACLPCVNFIEKREHLPLFNEQRNNLIELQMLSDGILPTERKNEIDDAVRALDRRIVAFDGSQGSESPARLGTVNCPAEPPVAIGDRRSTPSRRTPGMPRPSGQPPADSR